MTSITSNQKRKTFQSPYNQYSKHVGKPFDILGEVDNPDKEETGPLFNIKFMEGEIIQAWPEEIFSDTGWNP